MKLAIAAMFLVTGCFVLPEKSTTRVLMETGATSEVVARQGGATLRIQITPASLIISTRRARTCLVQEHRTYEITDHWDAKLSIADPGSDPRAVLLGGMISPFTLVASGLVTTIFDAAAEGRKHRESVVEADREHACPVVMSNVPVSVAMPAASALHAWTDAVGQLEVALPASSGVVEVSTPTAAGFINYVAPGEAGELRDARKIVASCGAQHEARGLVRIAIEDEKLLVDARDPGLAKCIHSGITGLRHASDHPLELAFSYRF